MAGKFADIKITELDVAASGASGQGALSRIILTLSDSAPSAWANYFNQRWEQQIYMMKRRASVFGNKLEITCMPYELEKDHLPELNKVIAETNEAYRAPSEARGSATGPAEEAEKRHKQELSDLKGRIKFD